MDLNTLSVNKVIVHEVPKRPTSGTGSPVVHSEVESQLNPALRNYFRERILGSLTSAGFRVVFEPGTSSPVPGLLSNYLQSGAVDFVTMSQQVATHLHQSQTGVNTSGLLCLAEVRVNSKRGIAILKLDKEDAVRIEPTNVQGNITYDLEHVRNLILTRRTKVFKAGLFYEGIGDSGEQGIVSDHQRGYTPSTEVADFFLKGFLGCSLLEAPDVATKQFFYATEEFIEQEVVDPEVKAQYAMALLAELNSQHGAVNPTTFAQSNLRLDDQQHFLAWLAEHEAPIQRFEKDTELIKNHLRRVSVDFESGVGVLIPPDAMEQQVTISSLDDGRTHLEVRDKIAKMRGK